MLDRLKRKTLWMEDGEVERLLWIQDFSKAPEIAKLCMKHFHRPCVATLPLTVRSVCIVGLNLSWGRG